LQYSSTPETTEAAVASSRRSPSPLEVIDDIDHVSETAVLC
jgi:hypothetical protein